MEGGNDESQESIKEIDDQAQKNDKTNDQLRQIESNLVQSSNQINLSDSDVPQ